MYSIKLYFKDKIVLAATALEVFFAVWSAWFVATRKIPSDQVFLHYNIIFGVDWAGGRWHLWVLPGALILAMLINCSIAWLLYGRDRTLAKMLLVGGAIAGAIGAYGLTLIVALNV